MANQFVQTFHITNHMARAIEHHLAPHMVQSGHISRMSTLLLDTQDDYYMRTSMAHGRRQRLLMLAEGTPGYKDLVTLRLEEAAGDALSLHESAIPLEDVYRFIGGEDFYLQRGMDRQALETIEDTVLVQPVTPRLYLSYTRKAFRGESGEDLQVFFDSDIQSRRFNLQLESGDYGDALLDEGDCLMEIHWTGDMPFWLEELCGLFGLGPVDVCRYEAEYVRGLGGKAGKKQALAQSEPMADWASAR